MLSVTPSLMNTSKTYLQVAPFVVLSVLKHPQNPIIEGILQKNAVISKPILLIVTILSIADRILLRKTFRKFHCILKDGLSQSLFFLVLMIFIFSDVLDRRDCESVSNKIFRTEK